MQTDIHASSGIRTHDRSVLADEDGSCYRSRGHGFDSRRYQIILEVLGLERGPLNLVSITEELLEWTSSGSGSRKPKLTAVAIRCADHATSSIPKSWH
jgi:hypothetical protein